MRPGGFPERKNTMSTKIKKTNRKTTNTDLCVDLKTILKRDRFAKMGKNYQGVLKHDREYHYTFTENASGKKDSRRNPHVYQGSHVNVVRRQDGTLVPTFCYPHYAEGHTFKDFCVEAAAELLAIAGLLGKIPSNSSSSNLKRRDKNPY